MSNFFTPLLERAFGLRMDWPNTSWVLQHVICFWLVSFPNQNNTTLLPSTRMDRMHKICIRSHHATKVFEFKGCYNSFSHNHGSGKMGWKCWLYLKGNDPIWRDQPFFFTSMVMGRIVFLLKTWTHDFGYSQKWPLATTRWGRSIRRSLLNGTYGALINNLPNGVAGIISPYLLGPHFTPFITCFGGPPCKVVAEFVDVFFLPCLRCSYSMWACSHISFFGYHVWCLFAELI